MAFGGGNFITQNKVLPGVYINYVSTNLATATVSDGGIATMPIESEWGAEGAVFAVTAQDFTKNSLALFGYDYTDEKMAGMRDLFLNAQLVYFYRLGTGTKASCIYGSASCGGVGGNNMTVVVANNPQDSARLDVELIYGETLVDMQTVSSMEELVDNAYVVWNRATPLTATAGTKFTGGTNAVIDGAAHQKYLDTMEGYSFNAMGVATNDDTIKALYTAYTKRMRDEVGSKFQCVLYNHPADYEGVVNVKTATVGDAPANLIYWVTGLIAGCPINQTCLNRAYDGSFEVDYSYTQAQLEQAVRSGEFTLHNVGGVPRVLADINSLVTLSVTSGEIFRDNQTVRVADRIATDIATLFVNKYLGVVPNDNSGRISLWADIVRHHQQLQEMRAIDAFVDEDIVVEQGDSKNSVVISDVITVVNGMAQLYMTIKVG